MQKIIYTHTASGQAWDWLLPKILYHDGKSIMGITESNMAQFGIVKTVVELPDPPQPDPTAPRYSKLALCRVLSQLGLYDSIKAAIVQAGKWDEFLLAQDLAENDPDFVSMKNALIAVYPIDAEGILRQCQIEEDSP